MLLLLLLLLLLPPPPPPYQTLYPSIPQDQSWRLRCP
jgi:hypothetical protein